MTHRFAVYPDDPSFLLLDSGFRLLGSRFWILDSRFSAAYCSKTIERSAKYSTALQLLINTDITDAVISDQ